MGVFRHKKTGKLYSLESDDFMSREWDEEQKKYIWRTGWILYKALYPCEVGPYFSRCPEDFYANFEEIHGISDIML